MNSGALGVEVSVAGKLRSERAHFEKHSAGIIPKSGDVAERVVKVGVSHVLTKMGLMGIQLKIALKNEVPQEFELSDLSMNTKQQDVEFQKPITTADSRLSKDTIDAPTTMASSTQEQEAVVNKGNTNGQG
jgi:small subunit ribosomal protein S3